MPPGLHHATTPPILSSQGQFYHHNAGSHVPPPTAGLLLPPPSAPLPLPHHLNPETASSYTPNATSPLENAAYTSFLSAYPEYNLTWTLDALRKSEYSRIDGGVRGRERETYVDYMGGALYPESLVNVHAEFLKGCVLGNTHSESNRSVSFSPTFFSLYFVLFQFWAW